MRENKNRELCRLESKIVSLQQPELPTVPDAFRRTDYEGFLEEYVKRFQLRCYQRTQAERITVLKQINELQSQCLALAHNEANWRHFRQEDRIRQKRLDLTEMELDQRIEDLQYQRGVRLSEQQRAESGMPSKATDMVEKITHELEQAIRTEAGVKQVFEKARKQHPSLREWLDEWEEKVSWDLRERPWF